MTICTLGVCQRTRWASCSPLRCGQHCSTMAMWAAFEIYLSMDRVRMCDVLQRSRRLLGSNPHALKSLLSSAWATPAKTMGSAERAGTAMSATALELDTWDAPVKEVGVFFLITFITLESSVEMVFIHITDKCILWLWILWYCKAWKPNGTHLEIKSQLFSFIHLQKHLYFCMS